MDEKGDIITELRQQIQMLLKRIQQLEEEVARLKKNSHNFSKSPVERYCQAQKATA
jgi:hypothetical protein